HIRVRSSHAEENNHHFLLRRRIEFARGLDNFQGRISVLLILRPLALHDVIDDFFQSIPSFSLQPGDEVVDG
ncbi:hypothetical protein PMAYCL1PPCAC_09192, partial [Pristionchus mayeri]